MYTIDYSYGWVMCSNRPRVFGYFEAKSRDNQEPVLKAQVVHRVEPQSEQTSGDSWPENELKVWSGNYVEKEDWS